ncbi:MAG TPA: ABC transporter permease [Bryobacteraceae bacterium]|nr:ABC transporter permease [Bryobacteraceae bacterium]
MLTDLLFRIRALFRAQAVDRELDEELRFHLEHQVLKYVDSGLTREQAERRARMEFGGLAQVKQECRDARGINLLETLFRDLRYGLRTLRQSPAFTSVAMITLALGIGATTAIFSVVYTVLLRPLPYQNPALLVVLNETTPKVGLVSVSYPNFLDWRAQSRAFIQMALVHNDEFNLAGIDQPEDISGSAVSPNFLGMLGMRPVLGRDFDASEEKPGVQPVVLLSYHLWKSHFGGDRNAVGRTITLNGRGSTIIGVLPADYLSIEKADVIEPMGVWATNNPAASNRAERGDSVVIGRLAPGTTFNQARAEMQSIAARLAQAYPASNDQFGVAMQPIREVFAGQTRPAILALFGAVVFVLLIACGNVANLFLMRSTSRTKEIAVRMAVGASRTRIVVQMLLESFLLAVSSGLLGVALAAGGIQGIVRLIPLHTQTASDISLNGAVLLFAASLVVLSAFVFGLSPALHSAKADVQAELKESGKNTTVTIAQNRWRDILVMAQISLALILLVGAGLMMKSLYRLVAVDPGFQPDHVLTMELGLRTAQYEKRAAILNFWQQVLERVQPLPGVEAAALGTGVPLADEHSRADITVEGMALPKPGGFPHPDVHIVSAAYLRTLGIPLLRGRAFTDADHENAPMVAIINAMLAERFFHGQNPIGKRIMFGRFSADVPPKWITIVGIAADTKMYGLSNPARLEVYVPLGQLVASQMNLLVKSRTEPATLTAAIRIAIASLDRNQPVNGITSMEQLVRDSVSTQRTTLILLVLFSALALLLAAIGVYGVISYSAAQRTHEIGIRMALGAGSREVVRMVIVHGARIAAAGILIGLIASLGLMRLLANQLFSVSVTDPPTFIAMAVVLAFTSLLACYIPARRTVRVDPMIALRHE